MFLCLQNVNEVSLLATAAVPGECAQGLSGEGGIGEEEVIIGKVVCWEGV